MLILHKNICCDPSYEGSQHMGSLRNMKNYHPNSFLSRALLSVPLQAHAGLSHPFLGMGPETLELGKIASF